jgi:prophage regulatory protein
MQETILRKPDVLRMIGMKQTWLHTASRTGEFPAPVRLGKRAMGWKRSDVEAWLASRSHGDTDLTAKKPLHWAFPEYLVSDLKHGNDTEMMAAAFEMYRALHNAAEFLDRYFLATDAEANQKTEGITNVKTEAAVAYRVARSAIKKAERKSAK